jgi:flavin-dependent dehydrogenase
MVFYWEGGMRFAQYDAIVVGAGCAGLTAAIGLARAGFAVAVVEAGAEPGGKGVGGVCFAENLAQVDLLGHEGVEALAWERRLIERGSYGRTASRRDHLPRPQGVSPLLHRSATTLRS